MVDTLRHTILLLTLSCLMAACGSSETEDPTAGGAMQFDVAALSRATLTTSGTITSSPFVVYGDMINSERRPDNNLITMYDATEVSYDASAGQWTYDEPRYWFPGFQYSFVALHPAGATCLSDTLYSNNQLKFTYTQPANYKEADDLLIATHRRDYTGGETDAVRFKFDHILTNINVRFSYYNPNKGALPLSVNSIAFKDIPASATYSIAPAVLAGNASTYDYADNLSLFEGLTINGRDNLRIDFSGDEARNIPPDNKPCELFSDNDALLLIPNPEASTEMTITYTTYPGGKPKEQSETLTIPVSLLPGHTYTLSLSVRDDQLKFNFEVAEWNDGGTTTTTVPRK